MEGPHPQTTREYLVQIYDRLGLIDGKVVALDKRFDELPCATNAKRIEKLEKRWEGVAGAGRLLGLVAVVVAITGGIVTVVKAFGG